MQNSRPRWDYLVLTAACSRQAAAFESQLAARSKLGLLSEVSHTLVVPDPEGMRIGSGGASASALAAVLKRERTEPVASTHSGVAPPADPLEGLRVLILHAGGEARRLAAYGPCGKLFLPLPGLGDSGVPRTLFDVSWPFWCAFPQLPGTGQVVIGCGDVLVWSPADPAAAIVPAPTGVTGIGIRVPVETASQHGVYVLGPDGRLQQFLQKPAAETLRRIGAVGARGQAVVDSGILVFDPAAARQLVAACDVSSPQHSLTEAVRNRGCDLYREVCSVLCHDNFEDCEASARAAGSAWTSAGLRQLFDALSGSPFCVRVPSDAAFLHFGGTRQLLASARRLEELLQSPEQCAPNAAFFVNNRCASPGAVHADWTAWVEGCDICAELRLEGDNILSGCNVREPLHVPMGVCVDLFPIRTAGEESRSVVRWYRIDDRFGERDIADAVYGGIPLLEWLAQVGIKTADVWPAEIPDQGRSIWNAKLFPSQPPDAHIAQWLWMVDRIAITPRTRDTWLSNQRFSLADVAREFDHQRYFDRRLSLHAQFCSGQWRRLFSRDSAFSADDLGLMLRHCRPSSDVVVSLLDEAFSDRQHPAADEPFRSARMLHSLGAALQDSLDAGPWSPGAEECRERIRQCMDSGGVLNPSPDWSPSTSPALALMRTAMEQTRQVILSGDGRRRKCNAVLSADNESPQQDARLPLLCTDELAWGRAPVRLDLGGGWTDTPPYSLEYGGCVVNVAVDLNGQPPVHVFARMISRPVIQITSIDSGRTLEIASPTELLDFGPAASEFALVKAALAQCGTVSVAPRAWHQLLDALGGGLQITTLAAVPQGSGLGTSSILGAVVLAVIQRCFGRRASAQELFQETLRLEQALTTGGGWQDQVGGIVGGVKQVTASAGLTPDYRIDPLSDRLLNDPRVLLYYTGITRYAKDVLKTVVARVLNRERRAMRVLRDLEAIAHQVAGALTSGEFEQFGRLIADVWRLNVALAPDATNSDVDRLFEIIEPFVYGAKLLGAGGGGYLLLLCRSPDHAMQLRQRLSADPPNPRARFVAFQVNQHGVDVGTF